MRLIPCKLTAHHLPLTLLVVGVMLLFTVSVSAQSANFVRTDYPLLGNKNVVGDFNGDGKLDLAGAGGQTAGVMLGNGDGTFRPSAQYPLANWSQDAATGDFNGDGRADLIYTINDPEISLSLLTGNGDGTFNAPVNFPNTAHFDSPAIVATDLDNDTRLDVVVAHQIACHTAPCTVARTISVLLGLGDGTFQPAREIEVGTGMSSIAVGDFNRDGLKDLGIAGDRSQIHILLGLGDGTFRQQTLTPITEGNLGVDGTDIDIADFNGDTVEDLVVALALNGSRTVILIGNGDGTFRQPLIITEPGSRVPQYQAVGDYNGDGFQDLALSLGWGLQGWMEILNGNGDGTFQSPVLYLVPDPKSSTSGGTLVAADFNGDSKQDIVLQFVGAEAGTLALRNATGVAPPRPQPTPRAPVLNSPANDATVAQPITFDWADATNAVSYQIQIDDSSTFPSPLVASATVNVSGFKSNSLPVKRLWWRVRGVNSAGATGAWSAVRAFTPQSTTPPPSLPTLSALALSTASVVGGNSSQATVTLTSAAPSGGATITLASNNTSAATVPTSVTVAAGATSANFTVTTKSVTTSTAVTITASFGGVSRTATLTVTPPSPPPPPSGTLALTVTATGRKGERVTSNPSGISVTVGGTATAKFSSGATITLSVSGGREATWSGACSSGGKKAKTCRFTLTRDSSVTANVQ